MRLFDAVTSTYKRLDILVNCAGGAFGDTFRHGPKMWLSADDLTMALEFAPTVRVNAILPGHVDTPRTSPNRTPERTEEALLDSARTTTSEAEEPGPWGDDLGSARSY